MTAETANFTANRIATAFYYLDNVEKGGETCFPRYDVATMCFVENFFPFPCLYFIFRFLFFNFESYFFFFFFFFFFLVKKDVFHILISLTLRLLLPFFNFLCSLLVDVTLKRAHRGLAPKDYADGCKDQGIKV